MQEKEAIGLTDASIRGYKQSIEFFIRDLNIDEDSQIAFTQYDIFNWIAELKERGCKPSSINHYLQAVRAFLIWCFKHDFIKPFEIKLVKAQEVQLKFYTDDELTELLKKPDAKDSYVVWRTYAIICFVLATGARASTIINIKLSDVDFTRKEIVYTHLKNKHIATVPISSMLENVLHEYLNMWHRTTDNEWLFCDIGENQLTVSALRQALNKYCLARNIQPKGPHALRHAFARGWVLNNGNAFTLQKMLTHSSIAMTKRYVYLFGDDLKKDIDEYSPLDSLKKPTRCQSIRRA